MKVMPPNQTANQSGNQSGNHSANQSGNDRLYLIGIALSLGALFFLLADTLTEKLVNQGDQAAPFKVTASNGKEISLENFGGKVLVLNIWASWCKPCVDEMPSLNKFSQLMAPEGVVVLGISIDHDPIKYNKFLKAANITFPNYLDKEAKISSSYGTFKVPETYIIDRSGKVVEKIIGEEVWVNPNVISRIRRLL